MKGLSLIVVLVLGAALVALPHFVAETTLARGLGGKVIVAIAIILLVFVQISRRTSMASMSGTTSAESRDPRKV